MVPGTRRWGEYPGDAKVTVGVWPRDETLPLCRLNVATDSDPEPSGWNVATDSGGPETAEETRGRHSPDRSGSAAPTPFRSTDVDDVAEAAVHRCRWISSNFLTSDTSRSRSVSPAALTVCRKSPTSMSAVSANFVLRKSCSLDVAY